MFPKAQLGPLSWKKQTHTSSAPLTAPNPYQQCHPLQQQYQQHQCLHHSATLGRLELREPAVGSVVVTVRASPQMLVPFNACIAFTAASASAKRTTL